MSSNNDNAMTRFLFAILRQKCLKDIDWNKVAHDPILAQEITNGHAARMRYSRFRSAMLGLEPQRRNRTSGTKSKVTKSKKESKAAKKEETVKADPDAASSTQDSATKVESPKVKQESIPTPAETQAALIPVTAPLISDTQSQFNNRLLTPCSDTDLLVASHGYATSPASEMLHTETAYDFSAPAACNHEHASWHQSPAYSTFGVPYELDSYTAAYCEHQHSHHHGGEFNMSTPMMGMDHNVPVKHEEWDTHYE